MIAIAAHHTPREIEAWPVGGIVCEALALSGVTHQQAAALMGVSESSLSRQMAGAGPEHLSLQRMTRLPVRFWVSFTFLALRSLGLMDDVPTVLLRVIRDGAERIVLCSTPQETLSGPDRRVA